MTHKDQRAFKAKIIPYNIFQEKAWQKFTLKVSWVLYLLTETSSHISLVAEMTKLCPMIETHFIFLVGIKT